MRQFATKADLIAYEQEWSRSKEMDVFGIALIGYTPDETTAMFAADLAADGYDLDNLIADGHDYEIAGHTNNGWAYRDELSTFAVERYEAEGRIRERLADNKTTIWRREDRNTTPRGFGNPPTYSIDKPYTSDWDLIWAEPVDITLPDGYTIAESNGGTREMYDPSGQRVDIVDDHGHPAIVTGIGANKQGKQFAIYKRLDK